jgi:fluoride ion exporter CrcB/FEX
MAELARPKTVSAAVALLYTNITLSVVKVFLFSEPRDAIPVGVLLGRGIGIGLAILLVYLVSRGKNWARWLVVLVHALGFLVGLATLSSLPSNPNLLLRAITILQFLIAPSIAVLLVLPNSSRWYSGIRNVGIERPAA